MLVGLSTVVIAFLAAWLLLRLIRNPGAGGHDPATTVRRLFLYGLLYAAVVLAAQGVIELSRELIESDRRSNTALARALSFLIIGLPVTALLGRYIDRRLASGSEERTAPAWTIYLNAILATAVLGFVIEGHAVLHALMTSDAERSFHISSLVATVVWAGAWAGHWFGFRRRLGIVGDLHLAIGTIVGLVPLAVGLGGIAYLGADELYRAVTDDPDTAGVEPGFGYFVALAVVGAVVWGWYWLKNYRRGLRTETWYVTVVPVGALAGFVATIVGVATAIDVVGVWFLGEPGATTAVRHFDTMPALVGVVAAGLPCWLYHRWELGPDPDRAMAVRVYEYLLAFASLVAAVVGVSTLLVAVFDDGPGSVANIVVGGATTVAVAGPVWAWFWSRIGRTVRADPVGEVDSPVRRFYLFTVFGVGGLLVLISALAVLFTTIEDMLDGTLSRQTLHDDRVGLAILLTVTGVAWYHFRIYREDRSISSPAQPAVDRLQPEPSVEGLERRVVLVASNHESLARHLAETSGASVVHWHRTDHEDGPVDVVDLDRRLTERADEDLLVVLGADGPIVIPFVDDLNGGDG